MRGVDDVIHADFVAVVIAARALRLDEVLREGGVGRVGEDAEQLDRCRVEPRQKLRVKTLPAMGSRTTCPFTVRSVIGS